MALAWTNTSNPAPNGATVAWTLTGVKTPANVKVDVMINGVANNTEFVTVSVPPGQTGSSITVNIQSTTVTGMAVIQATETGNDPPAERPIIVGEILAYTSDGTLWAAKSNGWNIVDTPPTTPFPTLDQMNAANAGVGWAPGGNELAAGAQPGDSPGISANVTCFILNLEVLTGRSRNDNFGNASTVWETNQLLFPTIWPEVLNDD